MYEKIDVCIKKCMYKKYMYVCTYEKMYVCMYVNMNVWKNVCMYKKNVCMYVCM